MIRRFMAALLIAPGLAWAGQFTMPVVIQTVALDPARPYFIPTHGRVTTTIRFPEAIGAPDGSVSVFVEDATRSSSAEYLVTWQQGDSYFAVTPLNEARMANLNIPYQGRTYVFYFYPVEDPMTAIASLTLTPPAAATPKATPAATPGLVDAPVASTEVKRQSAPAPSSKLPRTAARLVGFLDRLHVVHATAVGPKLQALASAMNVDVAIAHEELTAVGGAEQGPTTDGSRAETAAAAPPFEELGRGMNDLGLFQIVLLRAVRDRRLGCIGFICLVRNTSDRVLTFDVNSFGARAGAEYLAQCVSDAQPILKPGEQAPAYFIVDPPPASPLLAGNAWKISVDLVSPRLNPGAVLTRQFAVKGGS
jgi:hypothetical protein